MSMDYKGYTEYRFATEDEVAKFYEGKLPKDFPELYTNEYLYLISPTGKIIDKKKWDGTSLKPIYSIPIRTEWMGKIHPRNPEQEIAFDMLRDPNSTIKLLTGRFGSGKTYLMTCAALSLLEKGVFERLLYLRNNVQVKDVPDIGFLPGDANDKLIGYAMPLADALGGIDGLHHMMGKGKIEIVPLGMIRGRDFKNSLIFCSECENLTKQQVQLIIGRVGEGSSLWFDGDTKQVDKTVFEKNSGLATMIDRLKGHHRFGYVQLQKTERSETAAMADLLD